MKQPVKIKIKIRSYEEVDKIPEILEKLKKLRNEEELLAIRFVIEI